MWRTVIVEQLPEGSHSLELRLEVSPFFPESTATMPDQVRYFTTLNEELVVRGDIGDYLRPMSDPQLTQQLVSSINELKFDFDFDPEGFPPTLWIHFSSKLGDVYDKMAVVLTLDVMHQGKVVATTHEQIEERDPDPQTGERRFWVYFGLDSDSQALQAADPATDLWELRFRADPLHVLWWESSGAYWDGEYTITVDWNDPLQHKSMANYE